ncbi:MAG: IS3 family transposase [Pseudomonadota bacterium]
MKDLLVLPAHLLTQIAMSRKDNCRDNAVTEPLTYAENYKTVEKARSGFFEYIEMFCNRVRRHSSIGYVSPQEHEQPFEQLTVSSLRR